MPGTGERWVDRLDAGIAHGTRTWDQTAKSGTPSSLSEPEVPDLTIGGPSRTRTLDPLIKRPDQGVTPKHTDSLSGQQFELWSQS